jgi:hypothetical protein
MGASIIVSINNGFPTVPKLIGAANNYIFIKQTVSESEFVNAIIPEDILPLNRPNNFSFFGVCKQRN